MCLSTLTLYHSGFTVSRVTRKRCGARAAAIMQQGSRADDAVRAEHSNESSPAPGAGYSATCKPQRRFGASVTTVFVAAGRCRPQRSTASNVSAAQRAARRRSRRAAARARESNEAKPRGVVAGYSRGCESCQRPRAYAHAVKQYVHAPTPKPVPTFFPFLQKNFSAVTGVTAFCKLFSELAS